MNKKTYIKLMAERPLIRGQHPAIMSALDFVYFAAVVKILF